MYELSPTVEPARRVEFLMRVPAPTLHPAPITTFGPIVAPGSIVADSWIKTLPLMLSPFAS